MTDVLAEVRRLGNLPDHFTPQQFDSEWNVDENREWLAQEILTQLPAGVLPDAVVSGVGTGGGWHESAASSSAHRQAHT